MSRRPRTYGHPVAGRPAQPHKIAAWGAHLLSMQHQQLAQCAGYASDLHDHEHHLERAKVWGELSRGLRDQTTKFVPGFADHGAAYRKAITELLP